MLQGIEAMAVHSLLLKRANHVQLTDRDGDTRSEIPLAIPRRFCG
jgi:hypothetical protein